MNKKFAFILLVLSSLSFSVGAASLSDRLSQAIGNIGTPSDEILDPEIAFLFSSELIDGQTLKLRWQIEQGYYLYQNRFAVESQSSNLSIGNFTLPDGKEKDDPSFGLVIVNTGDTEFTVPLIRQQLEQHSAQILVKYQGCKEDAVCYPPQEKRIDLTLPTITEAATLTVNSTENTNTQSKVSEQDQILQKLTEGNILANIAVFFVFGLLLSLTPCVFPMIPILSGIIVGQGQHITTARAFVLSLVYVIAMALTYAVLGILAGTFEINLQAASQNIWVILGFSAIFVLLALSMFGFFELQLPSALQSRLSSMSDQQQSGSLKGVAVMGILSAIIVGPCVAPPLAGALLYISQTGDAALGGLALFAMGLGFGVPLLIIGTSAGKLLPKAGGWMDTIKAIFGVVMLGVAIWFLERILPGSVTLLLWAALLIVSAVYMGALEAVDKANKWSGLWKGLGIVILLYGMVLVLASAMGGVNPLKPFHSVSFLSADNSKQQLAFKTIKNAGDLEKELEMAGAQGKFVMLDFYADWCVVCKEMETYTFSDADVIDSLSDVILLKADVTQNDEQDKALLSKFNLFGPPAILFFDHNGVERKGYRLVGFIEADPFIAHIEQATTY